MIERIITEMIRTNAALMEPPIIGPHAGYNGGKNKIKMSHFS